MQLHALCRVISSVCQAACCMLCMIAEELVRLIMRCQIDQLINYWHGRQVGTSAPEQKQRWRKQQDDATFPDEVSPHSLPVLPSCSQATC